MNTVCITPARLSTSVLHAYLPLLLLETLLVLLNIICRVAACRSSEAEHAS